MSLKRVNVVDWLCIEKGTHHVSLSLLDEENWAMEQEHLELLEQKLNSYLAFIESGEVFERLVEETGRNVPATTPIKVTILARYSVPPRAVEFLEYAKEMFQEAGFELIFRVESD